ncbi:hypothetical protein [Mycobacteroides abscessus]|nr:hypothetical protein [Mycobacteroides abscessus]ANO00561.1 hypothetical protein BAB74_18880 [Mycobacteroides abscessus]EIV64991.1 hypothetical protein MMCCUG48898_3904 [Mycobacteroides abscessus subsp. massiliense CCUG 48898 = JCM 15300]MBL3750754.1 hypothetical protein [Mycobacteroides abscessus subsp. massiliense]BAP98657.1 hypothetical protein MMASJCM_3881 [Mycobacteroides abscessus subsp. massiliense CCUG 48898 = JCM 15300]
MMIMSGRTRNTPKFDFRRLFVLLFTPLLVLGPWVTNSPVWFSLFCTVFFGLGWLVTLRNGDLPAYSRNPPAEYWMAVPWQWRADGRDQSGVRIPLRYSPGPLGIAVLAAVGLALLVPVVMRVAAGGDVFAHPATGAHTPKEGTTYAVAFYGSLAFGIVALGGAAKFLIDLPVPRRSVLLSHEGLWVPGQQQVVSWTELGGVSETDRTRSRVRYGVLGRDGAQLAALSTEPAALPLHVIVDGLQHDPMLIARLHQRSAAEDVNALILGHADGDTAF